MTAKKIKVQKPKTYFWGEMSVDKDIIRYQKEEQKLRDNIEKYRNDTSEFGKRCYAIYQSFLRQLLESKELLANKIGRKRNGNSNK